MALESLYVAQNSAPADAPSLESTLFGSLASTADMREELTAFLEKRKAAYKGE
jgi:enoyl-CoA hydratase/carnithine racemase